MHAFYRVAASPDAYQAPLREEALRAVAAHGWTKDAMDALEGTDSLLRESQRVLGLGALSMERKALRAFAFSDGTRIPAGTTLAVSARAAHYDSDPEFRGFRFVGSEKERYVSTGAGYVPWGYGRHAWCVRGGRGAPIANNCF